MSTVTEVLTNEKELHNPIFVVGCPRSGTGVLARTIGLAESVCYLGETKLIARYYPRAMPLTLAFDHWQHGQKLHALLRARFRSLLNRSNVEELLRETILNMIRYTKLPTYDIEPSVPLVERYGIEVTPDNLHLCKQLLKKYINLSCVDINKMIRILFKDFQLLSGKDIILEKTPAHVFYIPTIFSIFSDAKICHILRDGTRVSASYVLNYRYQHFNFRLLRYICNIYKRVQSIDQQMRVRNDPRYYSLRYENLLSHPDDTMQNLFNFLNLPLSASVVQALAGVRETPSPWPRLPQSAQHYINSRLGINAR